MTAPPTVAGVIETLSAQGAQRLAQVIVNERLNTLCRTYNPGPFETSPEPIPSHGYWAGDLDFFGDVWVTRVGGVVHVGPVPRVALGGRTLTDIERGTLTTLVHNAYQQHRAGAKRDLVRELLRTAGDFLQQVEVKEIEARPIDRPKRRRRLSR